MEGRRNVWNPWYLMILDKLDKMKCKFCYIVIPCHKDKMLFHFGYQHDGNWWVGVTMCSKTWAQVKALFANCEGIIFQPLYNMFVPTFNGSIENVTIEMPWNAKPTSGGKICFDVLSGRGSNFHPIFKQHERL
jgi:hypothetical protein